MKWHVKEGDAVKADQVLAEIETDKAVVEMPSPAEGTILKVDFKEGDVVKVGQVLVVIGKEGEKVEAKAEPKTTEPETAKPTTPKPKTPEPGAAATSGRVLATPSTRKLAREMGIDITKIKGTGPAGRVTAEDVKAGGGAEKPGAARPETAERGTGKATSASMPVPSEEGDERIKLTRIRKIIADRMVYSKTHIPHACGMDWVDVTRLTVIREKEKKNFAKKGIKLTYLPFIVKACAIALKEHPRFNANFDEKTAEIVVRKKHNIGIAVDTSEGLMVPVVKDVDRRSIVEIAQEIEHLASTAREGKLKLDEIRGGTFTITNVGSVGGMYSTPIINPPEIAIMGIHRIKEMPLVIDGKVKPREVLGLSLCFDHRVVDGAEATEFMNTVMKHLEDPDLMLVDMI